MVRRTRHGGIRAIGSGMARFFHPGKRIRKRWPAKARHCIFGAVITGEGERRVGQRQQMCYLVTIPEFGEEVTFHIIKKNFQVNVDPETIFESKMNVTNQPPPLWLMQTMPPIVMLWQMYLVVPDFMRKSSSFVRRE